MTLGRPRPSAANPLGTRKVVRLKPRPSKFPCEARKAYQRFHDGPLTLGHSSRLALSQVSDRVTTKRSAPDALF
jgi:hypothetical protein